MSGEVIVTIQLGDDDHVANVLDSVDAGDTLTIRGAPDAPTFPSRESIPRFHKVALRDLPTGANVVRDGYVIGVTTRPVRRGDWLHIHNLKSARA